jgi:hypothetical protein
MNKLFDVGMHCSTMDKKIDFVIRKNAQIHYANGQATDENTHKSTRILHWFRRGITESPGVHLRSALHPLNVCKRFS